MGGYGSGRQGGRKKAEHCRSLDVNRLHREGCLRPGWNGGWEWKRDGERVAWISFRAEETRLVLDYRCRQGEGEWESVEEPVPIVRIPCRYGGSRPYFLCPGVVNGVVCSRRVAKLYGPGRYFLCRHCYRLANASQSEDRLDRAHRRARKLRMRLGGDGTLDGPLPVRPKGMWRRTYERLCNEVMEAEIEADEMFLVRAARLIARVEGSGKEFWQ